MSENSKRPLLMATDSKCIGMELGHPSVESGAMGDAPRFVGSKLARDIIVRFGITMSCSKFYKLTASNELPCRRVRGRLLFDADEIREWCLLELGLSGQPQAENPAMSIVNAGLRRTRKGVCHG